MKKEHLVVDLHNDISDKYPFLPLEYPKFLNYYRLELPVLAAKRKKRKKRRKKRRRRRRRVKTPIFSMPIKI